MSRPQTIGLTQHELSIMKILWAHSPITVGNVLSHWAKEPKPAYTSLLTAVQGMEKKGYLKHSKQGKAFVYSPVLKRNQYRTKQIKYLIGGLFDGSAYEMAVNLITAEDLKDDEVNELKKLLEDL